MHNFNLDQLGAFVQGGIYTTLLAFSKTAYNGLNLSVIQKSKTVIEVSAVIKSQKMQSYSFSLKDSTDAILRNTLSFSEEIDNNFQEWEEKAEDDFYSKKKETESGLVSYLQNQNNFLHPY